MDATSDSLVSKNEIPIIDLADIGSVNAPSTLWLEDKGKQLNNALNTTGLAFLVNHGIAEERLQAVNKIMDTFCDLPDNVKELYKLGLPDYGQGYIPVGMESLTTTQEMKHAYNIKSLSKKLPAEEIPNFMEEVGGLVNDFLKLSHVIMRLIAVALGLDFELFLSYHKGMMKEDNLTTFRMIYYPPLGEEPSDNITRCGEHSDWGTFTLLTQDSEGGLEVFVGDEWRHVGHFPGAILLNLGDMMELWTSSQYKAIKHRVVVPSDANVRSKGRHSLAFFVHPDNSTTTDPVFLSHCRTGKEMEVPKDAINAFQDAKKKQAKTFGLY